MKEIVIQYKVEEITDDARVSTMYCFKNCSVNEN